LANQSNFEEKQRELEAAKTSLEAEIREAKRRHTEAVQEQGRIKQRLEGELSKARERINQVAAEKKN